VKGLVHRQASIFLFVCLQFWTLTLLLYERILLLRYLLKRHSEYIWSTFDLDDWPAFTEFLGEDRLRIHQASSPMEVYYNEFVTSCKPIVLLSMVIKDSNLLRPFRSGKCARTNTMYITPAKRLLFFRSSKGIYNSCMYCLVFHWFIYFLRTIRPSFRRWKNINGC